MKITFILITILINFFNPLFTKSEENIRTNIINKQNTLEKSKDKENSNITKIHIVRVGDTISSISKLYSIDKKLIVKLNNLKDENYIFVGQNLVIENSNRLPLGQTTYKNTEDEYIHFVQAGENLTEISNKYRLNLGYLIEINNIDNPDSIEIGDKILLTKINQVNSKHPLSKIINDSDRFTNINKKKYGPLTIQSEKLEKLNRRQILHVSNKENRKLILSIGCETNQLDVRIPGRKWRGWKSVSEDFEKKLINDFC